MSTSKNLGPGGGRKGDKRKPMLTRKARRGGTFQGSALEK